MKVKRVMMTVRRVVLDYSEVNQWSFKDGLLPFIWVNLGIESLTSAPAEWSLNHLIREHTNYSPSIEIYLGIFTNCKLK